MSILIVDDDQDYRTFLKLALEEMGHSVIEADCGKRALEVLAEEDIDVLLLDLYMPEMGGDEVLARLPPGGPRVVLLTGAPVADVSAALSRQPHYYLPKGAGPDALALLLDSLHA